MNGNQREQMEQMEHPPAARVQSLDDPDVRSMSTRTSVAAGAKPRPKFAGSRFPGPPAAISHAPAGNTKMRWV